MAKEQDWHDDLKAFEAALAALTPRSDRLDRERLMFMAGQASAGSREGSGQQSAISAERSWATSGEEEGSKDGEDARIPMGGLSGNAGSTSVHAGTAFHVPHWGWPVAFGGMTAVAIGLLAALVFRPPQVVERIANRDVQVPAASRVAMPAREDRHDHDTARAAAVTPPPRQLAEYPAGWMAILWAAIEKTPSVLGSPANGATYMQLRDLALSRGLDAWPTDAALAATGDRGSSPSHPFSQRELLKELLEKSEGRRPGYPGVSPESTFRSGAKS